MQKDKYKYLPLFVTVYMLFALSWWTVLLLRDNTAIYELKVEMLRQESVRISADSCTKLEASKNRKSYMIIGEGLVFGISLIIGLFFVQRAHRRALKASEQQNNFHLAITHELKSPLTSIMMGQETLLQRELNADIRKEIISDSHKEAKRLEGLINNLLLVNKIHDHYEFTYRTTDIDDYVKDFISKFHENDQIELNLNAKQSYQLDRVAFDIVLSNLIQNAIKYGNNNYITIETESTNKKLILRVKDLGNGIPNQYKKEVFKKFYRVGNENTRKSKGTGLGLYIVKSIIQGHGGEILVKDNTPSGCIFEMTIPEK